MYVIIWMNLEDFMLSERNPSEKNHILCDPNLRNSGTDTTLETVERLIVAVCSV